MLAKLFVLFTVVTLTELFLLVELYNQTSIWFTIGLVLATGFVGASLARWQGLQTWTRLQRELAAGRPPGDALVDGLLILVAGTLLCTPGILTDLFGFSLLIPPLRALIKSWLKKRFAANFQIHTPDRGWTGAPFDEAAPGPRRPEEIIDSHMIDE